jgi:phosphoserine aminotransferase
MNVTFRMAEQPLEKVFLKLAEEAGFSGLAGHRNLGGMRASLYNGLTVEAAADLADFIAGYR